MSISEYNIRVQSHNNYRKISKKSLMTSLAFNRSLQSMYHYIAAFHHDNIFQSYFVMIKECQ